MRVAEERSLSYLRLGAAELAARAEQALTLLGEERCTVTVEETQAILEFVATALGPDTYVDLMAQYYPAGLVGRDDKDGYREIDRHLYREERLRAVEVARDLGLRLDARSVASAQVLHPAGATA